MLSLSANTSMENRKRKMSNRLVRLYVGMIILLIGFCAAIFYKYNERAIKAENINNLKQLADTAMQQVDSKLTGMEEISLNLLKNAAFMEVWEENIHHQTEENRKKIEEMLIDVYRNKNDIRRVAAFDNNGNYYCTGIVDVEPEAVREKVRFIQDTYKLNQANTRIFNGSSRDFWEKGSQGTVVTEVKPIKNQNAEIIGYIEVQQNVFYIRNICDLKMNNLPLGVVVFVGDGDDIFYENIRKKDKDAYLTALRERTKAYSKIKETDTEILCTVQSNYYHARIVLVMGKENIYRSLNTLLKSVFVLVAMLMAVTISYVLIVTKKVFTPINRLVVHMSKMNLDHFEEHLDLERKDYETEILADTYEKMLYRLKDSMAQRERLKNVQTKTMFSILQSEISPHFLYNTLGSIANMCEEGKAEEAAKSCYDLSDILRYASDYKSYEVPIREEVRNLEEYLSVMKTRYRQRLEYEIFMEPDTEYFMIPKLTLQPLVENSIKYSLMEREVVVIKVYIVSFGEKILMEIKDNGCGISEEAIDTIRERLLKVSDEETLQEMMDQIQIGGMGLSGTLMRMAILFQENFSYELTNRNDEKGTTILLKIDTRDYR